MKFNRRNFLKSGLCAAGGAALPLFRGPWIREANADIRSATWEKAPCRFCGTGCGVEVAIDGGKILAVRGDELSPVNEGLLCAKGYGLAEVLYAEDRLTTPQIRDEHGALQDATWEDAIALIATKWGDAIRDHGHDSVAMFGSGQWTIPEGYAALKLMKAGVKTNNLEPNARFCMASAVVGFLTTYGIDEPAGCYDDFDIADTFFLWGANMAEMHPMLFNRILRRQQADDDVQIINLTTFGHMTNEGATESHLFEPHSDLYLANAIAYVLLNESLHDRTWIDNHTNFMVTAEGGDNEALTFDEYKTFLEDYKPADVADAIGISAENIERFARIYGDDTNNTVSLWTMGMNQHTRGVWINNLVHNLHLLTGKVAKPGNSPFSLTGQPSACGTCREVGTFTHRLPSDRLVANEVHRNEVEDIWGVDRGTIPSPTDSPLTHAMAMFEKLAAGTIKSMWINTTNPFQTVPNLNAIRQRIADSDAFIVVSDIYPTASTEVADVVLPSACWVEKEGMFGNSERRTQHFAKLVDPPGLAKGDAWQFVEVARAMGYDNLFPEAWDDDLDKKLYEEYRLTTLGTHHDIAPYDLLVASRGMRWPVIDGEETRYRFNNEYDPEAADDAVDGIDFYGKGDGKAVIWARPYEAPAESPDDDYPYWLCTGRVLEHWHSGTMTRRVHSLHQAVPEALIYLNDADAAGLSIEAGDRVRVESRRGQLELTAELECRIRCPPGMVYVPFFDEDMLINNVTLGAIDPMSKQPDYKKCAVKISKVSA